jgi:hypothetical protein
MAGWDCRGLRLAYWWPVNGRFKLLRLTKVATMKTYVFVFALVGVLFATASTLPSQNNSGQTDLVVIAWQIRLDDPTAFDFSNLKVDIQYRFEKYGVWKELSLITPAGDGRFVTTTPAGTWVSVHVTTGDPTVSWETGEPKRSDSYTMDEGLPQTVFREEKYVEPGPARTLQRVLQFHRGAAFTICVPPSMKSGTIRYHLRSKGAKGGNILTFSSPEDVMHVKVGGLMPGRWIVEFVDESDNKGAVVLSQELDLRRGQLLNPQCRSGLISNDETAAR